MNINCPPRCATATAAATLIGGPLLGVSRFMAAGTGYFTALTTKDLIEDTADDFVSYLDKGGYLSTFGKDSEKAVGTVAIIATSIALNALALFAAMHAVSFAASYVLPVASFSFAGAIATSTVASIQDIYRFIICPMLFSEKKVEKQGPPPLEFPQHKSKEILTILRDGKVSIELEDKFLELVKLKGTPREAVRYNAIADGKLFLVHVGKAYYVRPWLRLPQEGSFKATVFEKNGVLGFEHANKFLELTKVQGTPDDAARYNAIADDQLFLVEEGTAHWVCSLDT